MSYSYEEMKPEIFLEENQKKFLAVRDWVKAKLERTKIIRLEEVTPKNTGAMDGWLRIACVDRLVELGELREIPTTGRAQDRFFVEP